MDTIVRSEHGHHKISAAIFVGALIIACALVLSAELTKPARYEYHALQPSATNAYLIYDNSTGRATVVSPDVKKPLESLEDSK